jgi:hypothetical protein
MLLILPNPDRDVQVIPSGEVIKLLAPSPDATHKEPFQAIAFIPPVTVGTITAVHVIPSSEVAISSSTPRPPAAQSSPFHATVSKEGPNPVIVCAVHVIPSEDVEI